MRGVVARRVWGPVVFAVALAAPAAAQVTIDDFGGAQGPVEDPGTSANFASPGGTVLGSERDLQVSRRSGTGTVAGEVTAAGELTYTAPASTSGVLLVDWDGTDGAAGLDTGGLGGVDLTAGGHDALTLTVDAAGGGTVVQVDVWDTSGNRSVERRVLPPVALPVPLVFAYSDFSGGASFASVGAVRLRIEGEALAATFSGPFRTTLVGGVAIAASKVDALAVDNDADGEADPGDTLEYSIVVSSGGAAATGVTITDMLDGDTTLVAGSVEISPLARDDAYACISNVGIVVPAASGVLANDVDLDGGTPTATFFQTLSAEGGVISGTAGDGSFTYVPPAGFVGTDFFSYSILDDEGDTDFASVAVTCSNPIWFVDDLAAGGGNGTLGAPFNSLAPLQGGSDPDAPGDCIHLQGPGAADYTGGLVLEDDQILIGTGAGGTLADRCGIGTVPPHTPALPALSTLPASRPTIANAAGHGITLAADNAIRGVDVDDTSGAGIFGNAFSTLFVSDVSVTGIGQAIDLANGTLNVVFDTLSATNTGAGNPGIELNTVGGSFTVTTTSLTEGGGAIGGNGIDVQNASGAASFDFGNTTVTKNVSAGKGVNLSSNGSASFTFDSLSITTTNSTGLDADTSGTLNVTGAANAVSSGQGTAVRIKSTTIGASGVTFRSVSSSGGTATGIILDSTGTTAGFTVTGSGTAGSGGTIASKSGADGATDAGIGIFLNNTTSPSFTRMQLNDFSNFAIRGTAVSGFTLASSVISGTNGSSTAADEGSVSFTNLTGSASFTSNTISGGHEDNVVVINDTGTLDRMTVSGSTIGLNATATGNDGITVESRMSSTLKLSVLGTSFLGARGDMVQCNAVDTSTMDCVIKDNTFANAHPNIVPGGGGITISGGGATANINLTYEVSGTTAGAQSITGAVGFAITANAVSGTGTMTGTIKNNHIGTPGVAGSGSTTGGGVLAAAAGTVTHTVTIDNNRVRRIGLGGGTASGIDIVANMNGTPRPQMNATVVNNDVAELEGAGGFAGMNVTLAGSGTENGILCVDVRNNVFDASGGSFAGAAIFSQQLSAVSNFNYPGYSGSPNGEFAFLCTPGTASADLNTFLTGTNGNTLTDGPFPLFPGIDAAFNCGTTGTGSSCP